MILQHDSRLLDRNIISITLINENIIYTWFTVNLFGM